MPLISQACIEQMRQRVSIVDVVSPYVQLKPAGHMLKGLSPFSNEKTASFFVDPQKNIFKCFSSGYAGDMFRFLELKEQLSFVEAIEWIAEKFNITLEYVNGHGAHESGMKSIKKQLLEMYAKVEQFFTQCFWAAEGKRVRAYWNTERGFCDETARNFSIGFAPIDRFAVYKLLSRCGYKRDALEQSGLFYTPKSSQAMDLVCRYQGRLMIPIKDIQGRTIAFSGRLLPFIENANDPTREAKYVNSPETPIFIKGNQLFNIHFARQNLDSTRHFFLVEGPLDVIRCWECGLKTAVAPQGTGLTEAQLKLLQRYSSPIIGMFDGDPAGIKAGLRLMDMGLPLDLQLRYVLLSQDEDPDSTFKKQTLDVKQLLDNSLTPVPFILNAFRRMETEQALAERRAIHFVFSVLVKCSSSLLQHDLLRSLSGELGLPLHALEADFSQLKSKEILPRGRESVELKQKRHVYWESAEGQLLSFLFHNPQWVAPCLQTLSLDWIDQTELEGQVLFKIVNELLENGADDLSTIEIEFLHLNEAEKELYYQIQAESGQFENDREILVTILQQLYKKFLKKCISSVDKEMAKSSNINSSELSKLHLKRYQLKQALANVHLTITCDEQ